MSKLRDQFEQSNVATILKQDFIRKAKDRKYYGYTFDQAGRHPISAAIDFMTKDGNRFGVYYVEMSSPVRFNLGNSGSGQYITIRLRDMEIVLEGRNLQPVYEYLLEQRLVWVKEADSSFVADGEDVVIERIRV